MDERVLVIEKKASKDQVSQMAKHFPGYIKIVVDIEKGLLCGGADRHADEELVLLEKGSEQKNLWGGGFDLETGEIDYNSVINLRPNQDNPSRDILDKAIRGKFDGIVKNLLL